MSRARFQSALVLASLFLLPSVAKAQDDKPFQMRDGVSREQILDATLEPYGGRSVHEGEKPQLVGSVMCGYQGWFSCPGDGAGRGWYHWQKGRRFEPGSCTIDLWPDVSELHPDERYQTAFQLENGQPAEVYSALTPETVDRHFLWMQEHQIDGVFVQRFAGEVRGEKGLHHFNVVLDNCRAGANRHGRAWAVMYDLSGLEKGGTRSVIEDWKALRYRMNVGRDPADQAYLHHGKKPLVALWGIGFNDGRRYTIEECAELIDFLQNDPKYGGFSVMVGVPSYWRELRTDCIDDPALHELIKQVEVVSPWAVGRFGDDEEVQRYAQEVWRPDLAWCKKNNVTYLPVVFPGFSWHNLNPDFPLNQIPRRKGRFLWKQFEELKDTGVETAYVAMFDEVDEATAIFKCTNNPPVGESRFLDYEGLPTDHYLWLVGKGRSLLRGELPPQRGFPVRELSSETCID